MSTTTASPSSSLSSSSSVLVDDDDGNHGDSCISHFCNNDREVVAKHQLSGGGEEVQNTTPSLTENENEDDTCAICLLDIELPDDVSNEEIGSIPCRVMPHQFHLPCLLKWAEVQTTCPKDRLPFTKINVMDKLGGTIIRNITMAPKLGRDAAVEVLSDDEDEDETECMVCNETTHEDTMLLCDMCDAGYHIFCLGLETIPVGDWFCPQCEGGDMVPPATQISNTQADQPLIEAARRTPHARTVASRREDQIAQQRRRGVTAAPRRYSRRAIPNHSHSTRNNTETLSTVNHNNNHMGRRRINRVMVQIRREMAQARRQRLLDVRYGGYVDLSDSDSAMLRHLGNQAYTLLYRGRRDTGVHEMEQSPEQCSSYQRVGGPSTVGSVHALAISNFQAAAPSSSRRSSHSVSSQLKDRLSSHRAIHKQPDPDDPLSSIWKQFDSAQRMRTVSSPGARSASPSDTLQNERSSPRQFASLLNSSSSSSTSSSSSSRFKPPSLRKKNPTPSSHEADTSLVTSSSSRANSILPMSPPSGHQTLQPSNGPSFGYYLETYMASIGSNKSMPSNSTSEDSTQAAKPSPSFSSHSAASSSSYSPLSPEYSPRLGPSNQQEESSLVSLGKRPEFQLDDPDQFVQRSYSSRKRNKF